MYYEGNTLFSNGVAFLHSWNENKSLWGPRQGKVENAERYLFVIFIATFGETFFGGFFVQRYQEKKVGFIDQ